MISEDQFTRILHALPILQLANPLLVTEFKQAAFVAHSPAGKDVFVEGDEVDAIALLVSGTCCPGLWSGLRMAGRSMV